MLKTRNVAVSFEVLVPALETLKMQDPQRYLKLLQTVATEVEEIKQVLA